MTDINRILELRAELNRLEAYKRQEEDERYRKSVDAQIQTLAENDSVVILRISEKKQKKDSTGYDQEESDIHFFVGNIFINPNPNDTNLIRLRGVFINGYASTYYDGYSYSFRSLELTNGLDGAESLSLNRTYEVLTGDEYDYNEIIDYLKGAKNVILDILGVNLDDY